MPIIKDKIFMEHKNNFIKLVLLFSNCVMVHLGNIKDQNSKEWLLYKKMSANVIVKCFDVCFIICFEVLYRVYQNKCMMT